MYVRMTCAGASPLVVDGVLPLAVNVEAAGSAEVPHALPVAQHLSQAPQATHTWVPGRLSDAAAPHGPNMWHAVHSTESPSYSHKMCPPMPVDNTNAAAADTLSDGDALTAPAAPTPLLLHALPLAQHLSHAPHRAHSCVAGMEGGARSPQGPSLPHTVHRTEDPMYNRMAWPPLTGARREIADGGAGTRLTPTGPVQLACFAQHLSQALHWSHSWVPGMSWGAASPQGPNMPHSGHCTESST